MRVAVVGGKLQGVEASYLAKKAGWEVVLVDRNENVPAGLLCDEFAVTDTNDSEELLKVFGRVDFIVPALEDDTALENIRICAEKAGKPLLYDKKAYGISSSKLMSDRLFNKIGIPIPHKWPQCRFPVIFKPSSASGSKGVTRINCEDEFKKHLEAMDADSEWVIQEFIEGPSYSIEVICFNGKVQTFQVTELEMDKGFDCKRVIAPAEITKEKENEFKQISLKIAQHLDMTGIFDVEVIYHDNILKVLEIDARLPSQTPTAVYNSTGTNLLEVLWKSFSKGGMSIGISRRKEKTVIYEHVKVTKDSLEVCGEHIMSCTVNLKLIKDFFGAHEALTDYDEGKTNWAATLIILGDDIDNALKNRSSTISSIMNKMGLTAYIDKTPIGFNNLRRKVK
ncbi:3-methylornithine--L-lysine ligase PylC [Pseudobacteroides cellulosolvens]|uniref:Pyrrolysine biosynthesis protein PylC n=1 Tax=Pseudobacteroides cellulosolvens ATCC 35603 = DSM 2933 TaxID=398512 RepID=A0A0L6JQB3_9FIRM|nr:3-methylornithine--L-lysine ligase PylC [Pseudobacteroides cellulosolvens]KNY27978.1 Pyrrolysine biosynthesis protein PylC [Pseudobacteroides cellulosolvens ATCC 35603 = DSM 2933]